MKSMPICSALLKCALCIYICASQVTPGSSHRKTQTKICSLFCMNECIVYVGFMLIQDRTVYTSSSATVFLRV